MSDVITDSAGLSGPVSEKPAPRKRSARSTATKKVAETAPVDNVVIEQADATDFTDEGQKVITGPKKTKSARKSNSFTTDTGAVGSRAADRALSKNLELSDDKEDNSEKIGIWSNKNIRWNNVGALSKGYNIVTKEAADMWLKLQGIREATPEEIATHYGK